MTEEFCLAGDTGFVDSPGGDDQWAGVDRVLSFQRIELTDDDV